MLTPVKFQQNRSAPKTTILARKNNKKHNKSVTLILTKYSPRFSLDKIFNKIHFESHAAEYETNVTRMGCLRVQSQDELY